MVAMALSQAVIALHGHKTVAVGWAAGVVAFVIGVAVFGDDLFLRVELGLVAGSITAATILAVALARRLASGAGIETGNLIEALHDLPVEPPDRSGSCAPAAILAPTLTGSGPDWHPPVAIRRRSCIAMHDLA